MTETTETEASHVYLTNANKKVESTHAGSLDLASFSLHSKAILLPDFSATIGIKQPRDALEHQGAPNSVCTLCSRLILEC